MSIAQSLLVCGAALAIACRTPARSGPGPAPSSAPVPNAAAAVVQRQLDAYNAQDLEAFAAAYADDVVIFSKRWGQPIAQGKDALRTRYGELFRKYPLNRAWVAERRTEGDGVVLDHEIVTGRSPDRPDPWDVGWVRYEVEGGLIRRVELP